MKKNVYVVWDDIYHPMDTYRDIVAGVFGGEEWMLTTTCCARDVLNAASSPDLVVNFTIGCPDGEQQLTYSEQEALKALVEQGMGIMYVHAGLACIQEYTPSYEIALGHFASHPEPRYPTLVCPMPGINHPILNGVEPFEEPDEHYFCKVDIRKAHPFLCSVSVMGTEVAGWTQLLGAGRVACLTPGHTAGMLNSMKKLLDNAARWCTHQL